MARPGTTLERRDVGDAGPRALRAASAWLAGREGRRRGAAPPTGGERLAAALELRLARAVERRLGGAARAPQRPPGALERHLVTALSRRRDEPRPAPFPWLVAARRAGRGRVARQRPTLRALVVGMLARGIARLLVRIARLLGRGLVGAPGRRLMRALARRAARARAASKVGLLALLVGLAALAWRTLRQWLRGDAATRSGGALRLLRALVALLRSPLGRLGRAVVGFVLRELRDARR